MTATEKLLVRQEKSRSLICVGLDSDVSKMPQTFQEMEFPQFEFNKWIIDQTHSFVSSYKPNLAYYEKYGAKGFEELKKTIEYLETVYPDIFLIADAKRGDIDATSKAYASAIFDYFHFDAVTISPYLGREAAQPFLEYAEKAIIVLSRTSNPGAGEFQDLLVNDRPLWQVVSKNVAESWNTHANCMLVMGATHPDELAQARKIVGDQMTFLVPGLGAQGGDVEATVKAGQNSLGAGLILNSSRGVIFASNPAKAAEELRDQVNEHRIGSE